jgi:Pyridine nucleotide-disulphide oxidoreductase, dimerisation domain
VRSAPAFGIEATVTAVDGPSIRGRTIGKTGSVSAAGRRGRAAAGTVTLNADPATWALLGAHIMGYQASLLIRPLVQAGAAGQRVADLARNQYWIHPALTGERPAQARTGPRRPARVSLRWMRELA